MKYFVKQIKFNMVAGEFGVYEGKKEYYAEEESEN